MPKRELKHEEVLSYLEKLPYNKFKEVVKYYSTHTKADFECELESLVTFDFQQRLEKLGVNTVCPKCGSENIVKNGKSNNVQRYKCVNCNSRFTLFTGTIVEKTKWHWDIWLAVLNMTINRFSLKKIETVLAHDYGCSGINHKTLFLWKHKLLHAIANLPMPQLTGVIQIDETFVREAQKGSRSLVSYLKKDDVREPRYGREPSKYGVMGPEFATITTAIDNRGYSVSKVSCLGKLNLFLFLTLFQEYLISPSYICSDANGVYEQYCRLYNIAHYVKPSNYLTVLEHNGFETPSRVDPAKAQITEGRNKKVLEKLYSECRIDYISQRGYLSYQEFDGLKRDHRLSLARVNELHSDIKKFIYADMANVSTRYLQDYIGFFTYLRNWKVTNGYYPSSKKDTEKIFIEILQSKIKYTTADINEKGLILPKPSARYISVLKEQTAKIREASNNQYFKFDEDIS